MLPEPSEMFLLPKLSDLLHLLRCKLERGNTEHIAEALLLGACGDGYDILVDTPSEEDFACTDGVFLGESREVVVHGTCGLSAELIMNLSCGGKSPGAAFVTGVKGA
jgi:hypothetical protein